MHRTETVNGKYSINFTGPQAGFSADAERFYLYAYKHIDILGKWAYDTGTGSEQTGNMQKEEPFHDVLCNVLSLLLFHVRIPGRAFCSRVCFAHARTAALNRFSAQRKLHLPGSFL